MSEMSEITGVWQKDKEDPWPLNWAKVPNKENTYVFFMFYTDVEKFPTSTVQIMFYRDGHTQRIGLSREALNVMGQINALVNYAHCTEEHFLAK